VSPAIYYLAYIERYAQSDYERLFIAGSMAVTGSVLGHGLTSALVVRAYSRADENLLTQEQDQSQRAPLEPRQSEREAGEQSGGDRAAASSTGTTNAWRGARRGRRRQ
jgi:hypothetical protein